jgi:hypothetical protein
MQLARMRVAILLGRRPKPPVRVPLGSQRGSRSVFVVLKL